MTPKKVFIGIMVILAWIMAGVLILTQGAEAPHRPIPNTVFADQATMDQATKFTFSRSVRVPGKVLAAGTYWFRDGGPR